VEYSEVMGRKEQSFVIDLLVLVCLRAGLVDNILGRKAMWYYAF